MLIKLNEDNIFKTPLPIYKGNEWLMELFRVSSRRNLNPEKNTIDSKVQSLRNEARREHILIRHAAAVLEKQSEPSHHWPH